MLEKIKQNKFVQKLKIRKAVFMAAMISAMATLTAVSVAAEGEVPETAVGFNLNFDMTQMFTWAQTILDAMMPVVYVTLGLSLGFIIINALKSAFRV